jgi:hypothetical protein
VSQPPAFNRSFSFTNFQAANPSLPIPGSQVDLELNNAKQTLDAVLTNLTLIQRDDGALKNGSVTFDTLSASLQTAGLAPALPWVTGTPYAASVSVTHGSAFYRCLVAHTSGTFATDLANGQWILIVDFSTTALVAANQIAVTPSGSLTTDVQTSLQALDIGKAPLSHTQLSSTISDSTAAGRALLTAANVAAQQAIFGLGSLAYLNSLSVSQIPANLAFINPITTSLIANINDWTPTGWATAAIVRLTATSAVSVTGFAATTDGDIKILHNVGTFAVTVPFESASSAAANRVTGTALPNSFILQPGASCPLMYDGTALRWRVLSPVTNSVPSLPGAIGLVIANNASTPNSKIDIAADQAIMLASGIASYAASIAVTVDTSTTGANGLDTGARTSSTWYNLFLISNGTTTAGLASISATAPTLPSGYACFVRVGAMLTDGSGNFMRTKQIGREVQYTLVASSNTVVPPVISSGTAGSAGTGSPTLVAASVGGVVPPTATKINVLAGGFWKSLGTSPGATVLVAPNAAYSGTQNGPIGSNGVNYPIAFQNTTNLTVINQTAWMVLESTSLYWASSTIGGVIACLGWTDKVNAS